MSTPHTVSVVRGCDDPDSFSSTRILRRALLAVVTTVAVGCGSNPSTDASPPATVPTTTTTPTPTPTPTTTPVPEPVQPEVAPFVTLDGSSFSFDDIAGEPTMFFVWAPWCPYCNAEAPEVAKIVDEYSDRITFVSVPSGGTIDDSVEFVDKHGLTGDITHVFDYDARITQSFEVVSYPTFVFADANGQATRQIGVLGYDTMARHLDELLAI